MAGTVDLWIYAVGDIASVKVGEMPADDWQRILNANLTGAYLAAQYSLPLLTPNAHMFLIGAVSERLRLPGLAAEKHWRRVNAPHLVALVKAGVEFPDGEAEMFQSEPAPDDPFTYTPSVFAASQVSIHNI